MAMVTDGFMNQINVSTRRLIRSKPKLVDNVFQNDPLATILKNTLQEDFDGGRTIQEDFIYGGMPGGSYAPGGNFAIPQKQIEQGMQFPMRFAYGNISLNKEDIQVINKGPQAAFRLIDSRTEAAYMTLGAHMSIAVYLNGQDAGYQNLPNGLTEVFNDGTTTSWNGVAYPTYGGLTRNSSPIGKALNSPPLQISTLQYSTMEETYTDASTGVGEFEPNVIVTTFKGYSFVKEIFQTQQRFNDSTDPTFGFTGYKFNNATVVKSRYCPGSYLTANSGSNDPIAVEYLTTSSNGVVTAYPTFTGETMWFLNARKPFLNLYVTNDEEFGFGFTGFKVAQNNTMIVGQVLLSYNITAHPRNHRLLWGFTA